MFSLFFDFDLLSFDLWLLFLCVVDLDCSSTMASKLMQLQSKAKQASQFVGKHGCEYYKQLMEKNKQYVVEPPTIEKCQELSKQLLYTRLARSASVLFL